MEFFVTFIVFFVLILVGVLVVGVLAGVRRVTLQTRSTVCPKCGKTGGVVFLGWTADTPISYYKCNYCGRRLVRDSRKSGFLEGEKSGEDNS